MTLEERLQRALAWVAVVAVVAAYTYGAWAWYDSTYEPLEVGYHSTLVHRLGWYEQGERVHALVVFDEGSVAVLEGRSVDVHLLDSENRSRLELQQGWVALQTVRIDMDEKPVGELDRTAHADDTYYIVYQNFDWWNLTLRVADGKAMRTQLFIKVLWIALLVASCVAFGFLYWRAFDVDMRRVLGLTRRPGGPGSKAAREPEPQARAARPGATGRGRRGRLRPGGGPKP